VFDSVVVGAVPSERSRRVLSCALEVAMASGARLHIVAAMRSRRDPAPPLPVELRYTDAGAGSMEWFLGRLRAHVARQGVRVTTHPVLADPADAIAAVAHQEGADLVVVGAGSHKGPGLPVARNGTWLQRRPRTHLGHHRAVADVVVGKVDCAVLVV
jgi:nucleotide-binding universal stress UspA family protein